MVAQNLTVECPYSECRTKLNPSNAAKNFKTPVRSIEIALDMGMIRQEQNILEIGPGNLRNSLYILNKIPHVHLFTYDIQDTIVRFSGNYKKFKKLGGKVVKVNYASRKYDVVICTFVLETICPEQNRNSILQSVASILKKKGILIASFRGYPGVYGSKYKKCPSGDGLTTPLNTFVKPYSIPEVRNLLYSCKFKNVSTLQTYRVDSPQNIHIVATI